MRSLLLRVPFFRFCRLQYRLRTRRLQAEVRELQHESLMMMVANMTISWAIVERMFDELIASYQHIATKLQHEHPRGLSNKLKYLRLMQCDQRLTEPVREWLRLTRIEARRLGNKRHEVIHGLVWRMPNGGKWQTQRVVYDGPLARVRLTLFTLDEMEKTIADISTLLADIAPKVWILTRGDLPAYTPEDIEKAKRELGLIK